MGNVYNTINNIGFYLQKKISKRLINIFEKQGSCKGTVEVILQLYPEDEFLKKYSKTKSGRKNIAMGVTYALIGTDESKVTKGPVYDALMKNIDRFYEIVRRGRGKTGGLEVIMAQKNHTKWTKEEEEELKRNPQSLKLLETKSKNAIRAKIYREGLVEPKQTDWSEVGPVAKKLRSKLIGKRKYVNVEIAERLSEQFPNYTITNKNVLDYFRGLKEGYTRAKEVSKKNKQRKPTNPKKSQTKQIDWYGAVEDPELGELPLICAVYIRAEKRTTKKLLRFVEHFYKIETIADNMNEALRRFNKKLKEGKISHPYTYLEEDVRDRKILEKILLLEE